MGQISTVTIGSDTFSVYALTSDPVADATSYHNVRIGAKSTAFLALTDDDKKRCLVAASDWVDRSQEFSGTKTVAAQAREWPRDNATCDGTAVTSGTTPDDIANATFWLAGAVASDNDADEGEGTASNIKSAKAGSAKVEFFSQTSGNRLPTPAHDLLACYNDRDVDSLGGRATGITDTTAFDSDDYLRSQHL